MISSYLFELVMATRLIQDEIPLVHLFL